MHQRLGPDATQTLGTSMGQRTKGKGTILEVEERFKVGLLRRQARQCTVLTQHS